MSDVKFTGRPEDGRSQPFRRVVVRDYWSVADRLRERPGEWALCFENVPIAVPNAIRRGVRALPRDEFEMKTANNTATPPRTCDVYLRYKRPRKPQL
jgi:hypothetical protein